MTRGEVMDLTLDRASLKSALAKVRLPGQAFIDGRLSASADGKTYATANPATGKKLGDVALCAEQDVNRAVAAARTAFDKGAWSRLAPAERKKILLGYVDLLAAHAMEIALLDSLSAGKPIFDCVTIDMPDTRQ